MSMSLWSVSNKWVLCALGHNVKNLDLSLKMSRLTRRLCMSSSLKTLNLCLFGYVLNVPTNVRFSNLENLNFKHIRFFSDNSAAKFIISCPILENLIYTCCNVSVLDIRSPKLIILKMKGLLETCEIKLSTPFLTKLVYEGPIPREFTIEELSSLFEASFSFRKLEPTENEIDHRAINILRGISNATRLLLDEHFIQLLSTVSDLSTSLPTSCPMLKHMKIYIHLANIEAIAFLLGSYPNLQSLDLFIYHEDAFPGIIDGNNYSKSNELLPLCMLNHLKTVSIFNFGGSARELKFMKFLLNNANVLEEMVISTMQWKLENHMEITDMWLNSSTTCDS
ncbi:hypothetical protein GIB67_031076 [Kingdonia uniflora]|uniref:FBD domain-containing protein n=1 Tax=Kingdonia uniflora TaxID=39325 RepID=A0A7J7LCR2_9MAGN|nr:hypothetical protein GIB67_031076 [Kingdonia uniflora]